MNEDKFLISDVTDIMVIGGYGNLDGNLGLLKYTENQISEMIKEENDEEDNIRLANSLIGSIRELQNNWNELKKWLEEDNYKVFEEIWVNTQEVLDKMQELEQGKDENNK